MVEYDGVLYDGVLYDGVLYVWWNMMVYCMMVYYMYGACRYQSVSLLKKYLVGLEFSGAGNGSQQVVGHS
jgi:hypothetical protein